MPNRKIIAVGKQEDKRGNTSSILTSYHYKHV
jgi:hypothetical protein